MEGMLRALLLTLLGALLGSSVAADSTLGKDGRRWLDRVGPLITPGEVELFERIDDRDWERFREIFWARRDPDPWTPRSEARDVYEQRLSVVNGQFGQGGLPGAMTAMGRVFLLLGPPTQVAHGRARRGGAPIESEDCNFCEPIEETVEATMMGPKAGLGEESFVTWRYDPEPRAGIPRGLDVEFRSSSTFGFRLASGDDVERVLERARRLCICDPAMGYEQDAEGRLALSSVAAADERWGGAWPVGTEPKVKFEVEPAFFAAQGDASYVPVLVEIEPDTLTWDDAVAEVTVSGRVGPPGEEPLERFRLRLGLARDPDGRARVDLPFALPPGRHQLLVAVQDDASSAVGTTAVDLVVPDFRSGAPHMSSVVAYADAREFAPSAPAPGHAFQFGRLRVAPRRGFRGDESLQLLFFVYGLDDSVEAPPVVQYALFHDGQLTARTPESPLSVSGRQAVGNTEIPLETFAPGHYQLRVTVAGPESGLALAESIEFEVQGPTP